VNTKRIDHNDVLEYRLSMPVNTKFPPLTVENYKLLPETGPRYQLIQGDLYMAPAPNRFHQEISRNLQFELHSYLRRNPVGKLFNAPFDVYLDQINVFQPDIIIVLNERLRILTEDGAEGAPEFTVEILSPKTRRLDLVNKKQEYARAGVKELWIIDPEPRTIMIHQFVSDGTEQIRQIDEKGTLTTALLPGFSLAAKTIFVR
jgi:Uma2 family endonuclease